MTPLQELVLKRLADLDLSYRQASARSNGLISHGHLNNLALGRIPKNYTRDTIAGLALALDLPRTVVAEAAEQSALADDPVEFKLPAKANNLSPKERKAVLEFVNALLDRR